jgi:hypothetical protein
VKHSPSDRAAARDPSAKANLDASYILLHFNPLLSSSLPFPPPDTKTMPPDNPKRPIRDALEPVTSALSGHGNTLSAVREALWGDGLKIISDRGLPPILSSFF